MCKHLLTEQGYTLNGIGRLLVDCQRRMASDWTEIGRVRREVAAQAAHVEKAQARDANLQRLRHRILAIRDEAVKQPRSRDFNIGWQLGRFIDDFELAIGVESSALDAIARPE